MTIIIIIITSIISILAFQRRELFSHLQFNAYQIVHRKEIHRLLSHGFIHADWWHLIVNMFVLYFFGNSVEMKLQELAQKDMLSYPTLTFLMLYLAGIVFASTITLIKHKDNHWYNSVGASGAVSAIMFFSIFFEPWRKLYLYGVIGIPGILFAILYVVYSQYQSRRGAADNINHDAHLLGAVFGFIAPLFIDLSLFSEFILQLTSILK